jgi:hypothetical protein
LYLFLKKGDFRLNNKWKRISLMGLVASMTAIILLPLTALADDGGSNRYSNHGEDNGASGAGGYPPTPPTNHTGTTVNLLAGWNLVDSVVAQNSNALVTDYWNGNAYQTGASHATDGTWVYVSAAASVSLPSASLSSSSVNVAAGKWAMIGNPYPVAVTISLQSGDMVYTYNGTSYAFALTLQPGQGAWLYSANGGTYSIGLTPPAPPAPPGASSTSTNNQPSTTVSNSGTTSTASPATSA